MQSSNPVFRRSEGFNGRSRTSPTSGMSYPAYGGQTAGYDPYTFGGSPVRTDTGPITIDSAVQKTAMTLGLTILVAAATWILTPAPGIGVDASSLYLLSMIGAFGGFGGISITF